jgi:hypothetical protein
MRKIILFVCAIVLGIACSAAAGDVPVKNAEELLDEATHAVEGEIHGVRAIHRPSFHF